MANEGSTAVIHQDLIEKARDAEQPVTEVIDEKYAHRTIYRAAQFRDGVVWRADIDTVDDREEFDSTPSVKFSKCCPDSDVKVLRDWSPLATGRLSGPQDLPAWEALFTVFNAVLHEYNDKDRDAYAR